MKKIILVLALIMGAVAVNAQITWNVKAGAGLSRITGGEGDMKFGWKIGVGIEKPLSENWLIMPTLEFKQKGSTWSESYDLSDSEISEAISITYIQLPIMAAYRIRLTDEVNMTFKAGPYFAYALSGKIEAEFDGEGDSMDLFDLEDSNRFDAGIAFGIDFEYHRFVGGLETEYGLVKVVGGEGSYSNKNLGLYVTLGYKF